MVLFLLAEFLCRSFMVIFFIHNILIYCLGVLCCFVEAVFVLVWFNMSV